MLNSMKKILRNLFAALLAMFARGVLRKYKPQIIMVTGSVGKTSTKDAVRAALSTSFYVRASEKSYNSEFGVPFTILGVKNPWTSIPGWLHVFGEAFALLLLPNAYPKLLVLEVGADNPGDLERILRIATPDLVVVTRLPDMPVHVEAYATPDAVREEEFRPAYALSPQAPLILSSDDKYALALAAPLSTRTILFGKAANADVRIGKAEIFLEKEKPAGMEAEVSIQGRKHHLRVRGAIGSQQLLAPAAALAAALALDCTMKKALKGLESYEPPPGRGKILKGKDGSILIDDSYNASPAAVEEALTSLARIKAKMHGTRTTAVLGDMLELGRYSQEAHERIGKFAAEKTDYLITIGPRARAMASVAIANGMPEESVLSFENSHEAAPHIAARIGTGDVILVKGSQSIRTEKICEVLLADYADQKYLVRQDKEWRRR